MSNVNRLLKLLPQARSNDLEHKLEDLVDSVRIDGWPAEAAAPVFEDFVGRMLHSDPRGLAARRPIEETLRVLLYILAEHGAVVAEGKDFRLAQEQLVEVMLRQLKEELALAGRPGSGKPFRIALLLAADYNAIISHAQREELIRLLGDLCAALPEVYADPFIADLLLIHRSMGLNQLEQLAVP